MLSPFNPKVGCNCCRPGSGLDDAPKPEQDAVAAIPSGVFASWLSASRSTARRTAWRPSRIRRCSTCYAMILVSMPPSSAAGLGNAAPAPCSWTAPRRAPASRQSALTTLEGLGTVERPHPLQAAFMAEQAAQCGYCISGMIMLAKALLDRNPLPSEAEVRVGLAGNLCRCGTHNRIVRAVLRAAQMGGRI